MRREAIYEDDGYPKARTKRKRRHRLVTLLASVVVFYTTYALILPAITLEKDCDIPEHVHTDECYTLVGTSPCVLEGCQVHTHTDECYNARGEPVCGYADFVLHTHNELCYDENGELWCTLPEIAPHTHSASCLSHDAADELHTEAAPQSDDQTSVAGVAETELDGESDADKVSDAATDPEISDDVADGELYDAVSATDEADGSEADITEAATDEALSDNEADDSAQTEVGTLVCGLDELYLHAHTDECFDSDGALICGKTQLLYHTHTRECCGVWELTCTTEEHTHSSECSKAATEATDGELVGCELGEYFCNKAAHTHTSLCYDADGSLTCTAEEHVHGELCLKPVVYCSLEEHTHTEDCYDSGGELVCTVPEHAHTLECTKNEPMPDDELESLIGAIERELDVLWRGHDDGASLSEEQKASLEAMLERLDTLYLERELSKDEYIDLYSRAYAIFADTPEAAAESCYGTNHIAERAEYLAATAADAYTASWLATSQVSTESLNWSLMSALPDSSSGDDPPSSVQIDNVGGTERNDEDDVEVSKTIEGTDTENIFDITLTVKTPLKIDEVVSDLDMAVVIVMDISNTMNDPFGDVTRYEAAMEAAEDFIDNFASQNTLGVSKIGYVAFNTDAHEIFSLQSCTNSTEASALKSTMRSKTGSIIHADGYGAAHNRFTNVEAGLKRASDMLDGVSNKNKYIVFLSDGFPTTYIESGYKGYDPYDTTGRFYDHVLNKKCIYGTSYSDEAAIRARKMATSIKNSGIAIFSIGVDVGGQTVQKYVTSSESSDGFSVVDRTGTTYEIGSATSTEAYKTWLKNSIGSGYYYDSTNIEGLKKAYDEIFAEIKTTVETANSADWVAEDPIPSVTPDEIEFIGMYDKVGSLFDASGEVYLSLTGAHVDGGENTAEYDYGESTISWDLKKSGYTSETLGNTTTYSYTLKYRVRLKNEDAAFAETKIYNTNGKTQLQYKTVKSVNGAVSVSEAKYILFPMPSVKGYVGELSFKKVDNRGEALAGAVFRLTHLDSCKKCRDGHDKAVELKEYSATSDDDGLVLFSNIPSGHDYCLEETKVPEGYRTDGRKYTVNIAYDVVTVTVSDSSEKAFYNWDGEIVNQTSYELPQTGGSGALPYTAGGAVLIFAALCLLCYKLKRRREENFSP